MSPASPTTARVPARVGLVGNPSDGYGGAVLAAVVEAWSANVSVTPRDGGLGVGHVSHGFREWGTHAAFAAEMATGGHPEAHRIVTASLLALEAHLGGLPAVDVEWSSTIPLSVGLAGSSAIAVATIEAVARSVHGRLDPRVVAALALEAEVHGLGIAAGWQDRIVQAHRGAVVVETADMALIDGLLVPGVTLLTGFAMEALVGWRPRAAEDSGAYHRALRLTADAPGTATGMRELADVARRAGTCAMRGDREGLLRAVDASWRARRAVAPLRPAHEALVEAVRDADVIATSPGSGGSVVAFPTTAASRDAARAALARIGADVVTVRLR